MSNHIRFVLLGIIVIGVIGTIAFLELQRPDRVALPTATGDVQVSDSVSTIKKEQQYERAKEIVAPAGFINTNGKPITIQELIGKKVILVDFWTYSCINCQRTTPYLNSWYDKYRDAGLEIIGVHTPEFEFEKDIDNVTRAVNEFNITYPVVLDNDYGTWQNYSNRYWPRKYLIDIDGYIVYDHIGEGGYDETEKKIQELLAERMTVLGEQGSVSGELVSPAGVESVDFSQPRSPETYFGSLRNINFGNGARNVDGEQTLTITDTPRTDVLYLGGQWDIQSEFAKNLSAPARITFLYRGQKVFMVARADVPVRLTILVDGQPVGDRAGSDVADGVVTVQPDKLYRLIEDSAYGAHRLEIIIEDAGLEAFTFTFG